MAASNSAATSRAQPGAGAMSWSLWYNSTMISRTIAFYLPLACTAMATATPDYKVLLQDGKFEVRTLAGRRQQLLDGDWWPRFTRLVNKPVQGTAADAIKHALILLQGRLPKGAV